MIKIEPNMKKKIEQSCKMGIIGTYTLYKSMVWWLSDTDVIWIFFTTVECSLIVRASIQMDRNASERDKQKGALIFFQLFFLCKIVWKFNQFGE